MAEYEELIVCSRCGVKYHPGDSHPQWCKLNELSEKAHGGWIVVEEDGSYTLPLLGKKLRAQSRSALKGDLIRLFIAVFLGILIGAGLLSYFGYL